MLKVRGRGIPRFDVGISLHRNDIFDISFPRFSPREMEGRGFSLVRFPRMRENRRKFALCTHVYLYTFKRAAVNLIAQKIPRCVIEGNLADNGRGVGSSVGERWENKGSDGVGEDGGRARKRPITGTGRCAALSCINQTWQERARMAPSSK